MVETLVQRETMSPIGENFRSRFEVVAALSDGLRDEAYRLRHSVYCEDLGFEALRSDGREMDEYDQHATAILIRHVASAEFVGCARLIRPRPGAVNDPLPFERTCGATLDEELIEAVEVPRESMAEVSRLAIISKFRRRKGEASHPVSLSDNDLGSGPTPRFPYLLLGLYLGIVALAKLQGVQWLLFLTEPRLAAHLRKLGFPLVAAGGPVEHRGTRVPSMINVPRLVGGLNRHLRPLYEVVEPQVRNSCEAQRSEAV